MMSSLEHDSDAQKHGFVSVACYFDVRKMEAKVLDMFAKGTPAVLALPFVSNNMS